jgi:hypothetical protein
MTVIMVRLATDYSMLNNASIIDHCEGKIDLKEGSRKSGSPPGDK